MTPEFRCGTVALLGEPNAGKSSLLNTLIGCQVSITAPMAGTTRESIRGILNTAAAQIIIIDTPGMQTPTNLLERKMNREISGSVKSADVICFMLDVTHVTEKVLQKLANYQAFDAPVIVVVSKIDAVRPEKVFQLLDKIKHLTFIKEFIPISAHKKIGLNNLINSITKLLPAGTAQYPREEYVDSTERQMAAEIIREAVINHVHDEVPAGIKIVINKYQIENRSVHIEADIICDKPNHKKIIIGNQGKMIRSIGIDARTKLEKLLGQHVVLNTYIIVRNGWRNQAKWLND